MANGDKDAIYLNLRDFSGQDIAKLVSCHRFGAFRSHNLAQSRIPDHFYLWIRKEPVLQNLFRAERIAAMHNQLPTGQTW